MKSNFREYFRLTNGRNNVAEQFNGFVREVSSHIFSTIVSVGRYMYMYLTVRVRRSLFCYVAIIDKIKPRYRLNMALRTEIDATPAPMTDGLSVYLNIITTHLV